MIHGMMSTPITCWSRFRETLEDKGFETMCPSLPFHNADLHEEDSYELVKLGLIDYVDSMKEFIGRFFHNGKKPIVIGHSMGGWIGQKLAELGLVEKLILINSAPPKRLCYWSMGAVTAFSDLLLKSHVLYGGVWKISPEKMKYGFFNGMERVMQEILIDQTIPESGKAIMEMFNSLNPMGKLTLINERKVTCPVFVMTGSEDKIIPPSIAKKIAVKYRATFSEFSGGCHFMQQHSTIYQNMANEIKTWVRHN